MLRTYEQGVTACIEIRVGDTLKYKDGRIGELKKIELKPNGAQNPFLVAVLTVKMSGSTIIATSDKFRPVDNVQYLDN